MVPEPQYLESLSAQPFIPRLIVPGIFLMLSAVHLNDHPGFHTDEIDNEGTYGFLALELETLHTVSA